MLLFIFGCKEMKRSTNLLNIRFLFMHICLWFWKPVLYPCIPQIYYQVHKTVWMNDIKLSVKLYLWGITMNKREICQSVFSILMILWKTFKTNSECLSWIRDETLYGCIDPKPMVQNCLINDWNKKYTVNKCNTIFVLPV